MNFNTSSRSDPHKSGKFTTTISARLERAYMIWFIFVPQSSWKEGMGAGRRDDSRPTSTTEVPSRWCGSTCGRRRQVGSLGTASFGPPSSDDCELLGWASNGGLKFAYTSSWDLSTMDGLLPRPSELSPTSDSAGECFPHKWTPNVGLTFAHVSSWRSNTVDGRLPGLSEVSATSGTLSLPRSAGPPDCCGPEPASRQSLTVARGSGWLPRGGALLKRSSIAAGSASCGGRRPGGSWLRNCCRSSTRKVQSYV
mmetsp:Transcript_17207/g.46931  ORF Transcript_17207/g.46931 Transcript_17207/m.46931 type:complete len:253 (+) Transcript_17207:258-1016(+)